MSSAALTSLAGPRPIHLPLWMGRAGSTPYKGTMILAGYFGGTRN